MRLVPPVVALALLAGPAAAQSVLTGVVREDSTERPVAGAEVGIEKLRLRVYADSAGRFRLPRVPEGLHQLYARRLGFYPAGTLVRVASGEMREVDVVLTSVPANLDPVVVATAMRGNGGAGLAGFEERRRLGLGKFIDSTGLRDAHRRLADVLRTTTGVKIRPGVVCMNIGRRSCEIDGSRGVAVSKRIGSRGPTDCPMQVVLDGTVVYRTLRPDAVDWESTFDLNSVPVSDLTAIEIYRDQSEVPAGYGGDAGGCGLLMLWTRRR